jgi:integrase/recombinase XerD
MSLLHHGVDLPVIALWLGHESSETVRIYLHADMRHMRLKESALAHANASGVAPMRYQPPDPLLVFLEGGANIATTFTRSKCGNSIRHGC